MSLKVAISRTVTMGVVALVSGVAQLLLARILGPEEYGFFIFSVSLVTLAMTSSALFGTPAVAIRLFAGLNNEIYKRNLCEWILKTSLKASILSSIILVIVALMTYRAYGVSTFIAALILLVSARNFCNDGLLTASGRTDVAARRTMIAPACALALAFGLMSANLIPDTGVALMCAWAGGQIIASILSSRAVRKTLSALRVEDTTSEKNLLKNWRKQGIAVLVSSILISLMVIDVVLVGVITKSPELAGTYGMAVRITAISSIGVQSTFLAYAPSLTKEAIEVGQEWKKKLNRSRMFAASAVGICLIGTYFWYPAVSSAFAPEYESAYWPTVILMIGILIEAISGPVGMILQARKRENQVIGLNVCVFVVFLITASILINSYGIIGAACSVSLTILIRNVVLLTMLHKTQSERCPKQT